MRFDFRVGVSISKFENLEGVIHADSYLGRIVGSTFSGLRTSWVLALSLPWFGGVGGGRFEEGGLLLGPGEEGGFSWFWVLLERLGLKLASLELGSLGLFCEQSLFSRRICPTRLSKSLSLSLRDRCEFL